MGMLSINTNVGALRAADAAYSVNKSMETSMERLSSGKRINSAIDDAAGLQIANRQEAEIRGFKQAAKNAADAQSLFATQEGALEEVHNLLQRLRELAVQSANGTLLTADRTALSTEANALEAEINRISDDTTWAGHQILDGSTFSAGVTFHIGPDASDTISHTVPNMSSTAGSMDLGSKNVTTQSNATTYITTIDGVINNVLSERQQLGAVMNRLDYTMANLSQMATNLSVSKGRIMDADFAAESANLARTQVLQQASMSMLAQANASKQNILSLFQ